MATLVTGSLNNGVVRARGKGLVFVLRHLGSPSWSTSVRMKRPVKRTKKTVRKRMTLRMTTKRRKKTMRRIWNKSGD